MNFASPLFVAGLGFVMAGASRAQVKAPKVDLTKDHTLFAIGYSHLDTEWCWNYPQVIREFIPNTLNENFALFDKYPDYVFNWTGSNRYRFMKEYYPAEYARLKKYIAAGRWFPAGSSVEEGDVNNPSAESLIRQVMYGNEFFKREFGVASNEYMLPDCFGFPASLPSILAHCGIKGFSTQKLTWGSAVGIPFNVGVWTGPDGQGVVSALNCGAYDAKVTDNLADSVRWQKRVEDDGVKSGLFADYRYYGVGDRGGAPEPESVDWVQKSIVTKSSLKVIASRASDMFSAITPEQATKLPHYKGDLELTGHSAGSLTSESYIKRWNRKNELLADAAEKASVAATLLGAQPYPMQRITDAWLRFLPAQFHDIMAGTALPESYTYSWNDEVLAMNEFAGVVREGVGGVTRALDTRVAMGGVPIVVYNPLSTPRQDIAEAFVATAAARPTSVQVTGPDGLPVPAQIAGWSGSAARVLFVADVPSVGFAVYGIRLNASSGGAARLVSAPSITSRSLENARYKVRVSDGGDIQSIFDKAAHKEMLSAPMRLAFQGENPAQFPAWNMDYADQSKAPRGFVAGPAAIKIVEDGPARVALQITRESEGSTFVQTVRLASGDAGNHVEIANHIDWKSRECALKAVFPLAVSNPMATYNWGLGTIRRGSDDPKKFEVGSHQWFDLTDTGGKYGVTVLSDCKNASDKPDDSTLRLTLLYTPGTRGGYQHQGTQDWGRHDFVYGLEGHTGDWRQGNSQWQAARLNQPLLAFEAPSHPGALGRSFALASVANPNVQIEALKRAENSDETIVRFNELSGNGQNNVSLRLAAPILTAREVDGQEQPIGGAVTVRNGALVFNMQGYRPRAFAIRLGKAPAHLTPPASQTLVIPFDTSVTRAANKSTSGGFDAEGRAIPAELLPAALDVEGVAFKLGSSADGARNAVTCRGQKIALPTGSGASRRVYIVAAASGGDTPATFQIDDRPVARTIQDWGGFIGQWDVRQWKGEVPELTYGWSNPIDGLQPGYIKKDTVAWYSDHWRLASGKNDPYRFCYLFRYAIDLPGGARVLTLPKNRKVRVLAITVASNPSDDTQPAQPLYDTLEDHMLDTPPVASPSSGRHNDTIAVTLGKTFYWSGSGDVRYTLDGSTPTASGAVYRGPIYMNRSATLKARQFASGGSSSSPISTNRYEITDVTPPKVVRAQALGLTTMAATFSEPLGKASAEDVTHYKVSEGNSVAAAALAADGRSVTLTLSQPILSTGISLTTLAIRDIAGNPSPATVSAVTPLKPVFESTGIHTFDGQQRGIRDRSVPSLPIAGSVPWTINLFAYMDHEPEELTVLAGFGDGADSSGAERYLAKFMGGIHFWGSEIDISSGVPFDTGKWQMITATYDGQTLRLYKNGQMIKSETAALSDATADVRLGGVNPWGERGHRFAGKIAGFTIWDKALPPDYLQTLLADMPAPPIPGNISPETPAPTAQDAVKAVAPPFAVSADHPLTQAPIDVTMDTAQIESGAANDKTFASEIPALIQESYPRILDILGVAPGEVPTKIEVVMSADYDGVAATGGGVMTISNKYVSTHVNDIGLVVHELAHVGQSYHHRGSPGWLVEGIADYVRWFNYEPVSKRPHPNPATATYHDSYRTTASFLDFVVRTYDKDLIKKLDRACKDGTYDPEIFVKATGKDLDQLSTEWLAALKS